MGQTVSARIDTIAERSLENASHRQLDLFDQFTAVLRSLAHSHPLLLLIDDLQWVDTGSSSLLFHLSRQLTDLPILIVGAYRPQEVTIGRNGERHPLAMLYHECGRLWGEIEIDLNAGDSRRFVDALVDSSPNRLDDRFPAGHLPAAVPATRSLRSSFFASCKHVAN